VSNYLIDASVYSLPNQIPDELNKETIKLYDEYLSNLNNLFEFIGSTDRNLKINYFLFSKYDIELLIKNNMLFFDKTNIQRIRKSPELKKENKKRIDSLEIFILNEINKLQWIGQKNKPEKISTIESYIGIDDIEINEKISCIPNISNVCLAKTFNKNLGILAFLNDKIYKRTDITKIITNNYENEYNINVSIQKIKHNFNKLECQNIIITSCIINSNIKELKKRKFSSIDDTLKNAKTDFKDTIEFSNKINESINEYEEILAKLRYDRNIDIEKIDNYKLIYPVIVYDCFNTLDKLVKYYKFKNKQNLPEPISRKITCRNISTNDVCKKCCGYLKLCGFDCSDENENDLKNVNAINERTIDNKLYRIHLKPYSITRDTKYADLTLRIYFRWDNDKIQVGWIGKHLYLP